MIGGDMWLHSEDAFIKVQYLTTIRFNSAEGPNKFNSAECPNKFNSAERPNKFNSAEGPNLRWSTASHHYAIILTVL